MDILLGILFTNLIYLVSRLLIKNYVLKTSNKKIKGEFPSCNEMK